MVVFDFNINVIIANDYDFILSVFQMFDWIYSNREVFLANYVEIGRNHTASKKLQDEHNQFTIASNVSI